uniref:Amino acid/amide ABC transporter ATP-binding protein 1, HAAT family n=1 Tax=Candidatus Kentrum sp. TUN TaxID=2126343 RepID=A0A450ZR94_9GAMM|nr:MAG: amino acid/amide ABC transporter ATP-binding protein 1, HAAT family [Candidatus Kentron sp. TUN]VFK62630.1 MAG: amino acid/amide ABC transporter ATP-binding protein 1, HAAT family [Candidatus Kentron sp. TUN]
MGKGVQRRAHQRAARSQPGLQTKSQTGSEMGTAQGAFAHPTVTSMTTESNPGASPNILEVENLVVEFGGIKALDGFGFELPRGAILGLIGPNGAGKTTLFNCLSRLYTPDSGHIRFRGRSILDASPHAMASLGIGRTFQNLALFGSMSVLDNIMVGAHTRGKRGFLSHILRPPSVRAEEARLAEMAWGLIEYLGLGEVARSMVADLPFGTQKRVELGRALASRPKLLLLDEPAGGLNHLEVSQLCDLIRQIRDDYELTILLVEHHMCLVMTVSDKVVAMDFGRKIGEGTPLEVQENPQVIRAYLGTQ